MGGNVWTRIPEEPTLSVDWSKPVTEMLLTMDIMIIRVVMKPTLFFNWK